MPCIRQISALAAAVSAFLAFAGVAHATGGNYVFNGGTPTQQQQVRSALEASSFNWSLVTQQITINIAPIGRDYSVPGEIYLDSDMLNSPGDYSWGVVQNEYANEVDFFLLPDQAHATFNSSLGGTAWCYGDQPGLNMIQYGCERFASTLAWSYWQSPDNCIRPSATSGISGGMAPAAFKALLTSTLGVATEVAAAPVSAPAASTTFTSFSPAAGTSAPAATSHATATTTAPTQTPAGPREIQTAKIKTAKTAKSTKTHFDAPLKVSIQQWTPTLAKSAGLVR